ncbi:MAG: amino acid permease [Phascolarctobacterium faecium]
MSVDSVKQKNISKTLTLWNFFTIGFGAIIGTGWIFLVGEWIIISGGPIPAMLAFLLGALLLLPIGAVFGELTSALPIDGGVIEYVDRTYGKTVSLLQAGCCCYNIIMCPWERLLSPPFWHPVRRYVSWLRSIRLTAF